MDPLAWLGWLAVVLTFARLGSQPWHNIRSRRVEGVSVTALVNNLVADLGWLWFGIASDLPPVWVVAAITLPVDVLAVWVARRNLTRSSALSGSAWGLGLCGAWALGGQSGLGAVLVVSVAVVLAPQVRVVLRLNHLPGLSLVTVGLAVADALCWGAYGMLVGDVTLVVYGLVLMVGTSVIGWRVVTTRRRSGGTETAPGQRPAYTASS
jgi:uncharacterized protein with PQ loop repeat